MDAVAKRLKELKSLNKHTNIHTAEFSCTQCGSVVKVLQTYKSTHAKSYWTHRDKTKLVVCLTEQSARKCILRLNNVAALCYSCMLHFRCWQSTQLRDGEWSTTSLRAHTSQSHMNWYRRLDGAAGVLGCDGWTQTCRGSKIKFHLSRSRWGWLHNNSEIWHLFNIFNICFKFCAVYFVYSVPVFHPTMEEFANFPAYIRLIEAAGASKAGLAKVFL